MRAQYILALAIVCCAFSAIAQTGTGYTHMFRIYEDNDAMNVGGKRTDQAYTAGTQLSVFYQKDRRSTFFLDRWMPAAGDSSINTFGWSIMQMIFTPRNLRRKVPEKNDYFYSAGLFATHSLHTSNPVKKYAFQTELMMGIMGPPALGKQAQTLIHDMIHVQRPLGWDTQLKTDLLLNVNFAAEKQLASYSKAFEWIGGAEFFGGTALNGGTAYMLIRVGRMTPYFNGLITQYTAGRNNRWQLYGIIRPAAELTLTNALLEGGMFADNSHYTNEGAKRPKGPDNNKVIAMLDYGIVLAIGKLSLSFTQRTMSPMLKGRTSHQVGNLSAYFAW